MAIVIRPNILGDLRKSHLTTTGKAGKRATTPKKEQTRMETVGQSKTCGYQHAPEGYSEKGARHMETNTSHGKAQREGGIFTTGELVP